MIKKAELRPSKKYAVGTVHEIISGKFEIIDRYLSDDGFAMLKYKFLDSGEIEENREVNIASNIAKFRKKCEFEKLETVSKGDYPELDDIKQELRSLSDQIRLLTIQQATLLQTLQSLDLKK